MGNQPVKVINVNKYGKVFDPAGYVVKRSENRELYQFLEKKEVAKK